MACPPYDAEGSQTVPGIGDSTIGYRPGRVGKNRRGDAVKKQSGQLVRQNSATDSQPTVSAGQDWSIRVNSVQREVQQQGRTTARMHDRRHRWLPAEVDRSWDAPVVRIEMVRPRWPLFGRQTTLNAANYCAPVSSISAGQQRNGQVADRRDTVYGSDASARPSPGRYRSGRADGEGCAR